MSPELAHKNLPTIEIKLDYRFTPSEPEFLDELCEELKGIGLDPESLVFTGFEGKDNDKKGIPDKQYSFGMNYAGWLESLGSSTQNPAEYATDHERPCIAIYDKNLLREVNHATIHQPSDLDEPIILTDIVPGKPLSELPAGQAITEEIIPINYPDGSLNDALIALVYIID